MRRAFAMALLLCAALARADETAWRNFMAAATDAARRGDSSAAASNYENAVTAAGAFATNDTRLAAALYGLGRARRALHELPAATQSFQRALAILDAAPQPSLASRAEIYNALGDVYRVQGGHKQAETYFQHELALLEKLHGAESPAVATALSNNLASLYRAQGRRDEAEAAYTRVVAILEKSVPADDERLGIALIDLAEWHQDRQQYAKAEPYYRRGIPILQKIFPPAHPRILHLLQEWGRVRQLQGQYAEAEAIYRTMLTVIETHQGTDHPNVAVALNNLVGLYEVQGRQADADALRQRMLQIANTPFRGQPYVPYQGNPKPPPPRKR